MKVPYVLFTIISTVVAQADPTLLKEIIQGLITSQDCTGCFSLLVPLQTLAELGDGPFVDTMVAVCDTLKVREHV
jgi:sphingomyelin phosphodiesterase